MASKGIINPPIDELLEKVDSKYQLVIFASKRARQINDYYTDIHEGSMFDNVGPLVDEKSRDKVSSLVDDAVAKGARVVVGGSAPEGAGWFYEPTVLTDVPADADLAREEIFGPVAPISTFTTDAEAIRLANDTEYGLVAYAYTNDLGRVIRVSEGLHFGMVGINQGIVSNPAAPFGGVKQSGFGREGGPEGIEEYLSVKYVGIAP